MCVYGFPHCFLVRIWSVSVSAHTSAFTYSALFRGRQSRVDRAASFVVHWLRKSRRVWQSSDCCSPSAPAMEARGTESSWSVLATLQMERQDEVGSLWTNESSDCITKTANSDANKALKWLKTNPDPKFQTDSKGIWSQRCCIFTVMAKTLRFSLLLCFYLITPCKMISAYCLKMQSLCW